MQYWLMKSEPSAFSIDDLMNAKKQSTYWDGVRNFQARNMLRDQMRVGDLALFYHSSCKVPGVVGIMTIVKVGLPDPTAFDPKSPYYDPKSTPDNPRWFMVEAQLKQKFSHPITLQTLKTLPQLANFRLIRQGNRLSILPVAPKEWQAILAMTKLIYSQN